MQDNYFAQFKIKGIYPSQEQKKREQRIILNFDPFF